MLVTAAVALALLCVGLFHRQLSRSRASWAGGVVPALWLTALVVVAALGHIDSGIDMAVAVLGSVILLRMWSEGREFARTRA